MLLLSLLMVSNTYGILFLFVCFSLLSCVPNAASFSGLSIFDCHFVYLHYSSMHIFISHSTLPLYRIKSDLSIVIFVYDFNFLRKVWRYQVIRMRKSNQDRQDHGQRNMQKQDKLRSTKHYYIAAWLSSNVS